MKEASGYTIMDIFTAVAIIAFVALIIVLLANPFRAFAK